MTLSDFTSLNSNHQPPTTDHQSLTTLSVPRSAGVAVKICGLSRAEDAIFASACGASMVGLVFAESRRQVTLEAARSIVDALASSPIPAPVVGVFVNELPGRLRRIVRYTGIDIVQLSGDETPDEVARCAEFAPVIKALRFAPGTPIEQALSTIDTHLSLGLGDRLRLLIDAYHPGSYGGTGSPSDWTLARALSDYAPIMLAGGLTPANVAEAIEQIAPWAVDVSSGVEQNAHKDHTLIKDFITATKNVQPALPVSY